MYMVHTYTLGHTYIYIKLKKKVTLGDVITKVVLGTAYLSAPGLVHQGCQKANTLEGHHLCEGRTKNIFRVQSLPRPSSFSQPAQILFLCGWTFLEAVPWTNTTDSKVRILQCEHWREQVVTT